MKSDLESIGKDTDEEKEHSVEGEDTWAHDSDKFYASQVCGFGPAYTLKEAQRNQILIVPRVTTDFPSLVLFGFFVLHLLVVWFFAMDKGQLLYLMNGMDWRGKVCGSGDLATYSRQAWINPLMSNIRTGSICVKDCPAPADNKEIDQNTIICVCNHKYWPNKFNSATSPTTYSQELIDNCATSQANRLGYFTKVLTAGSLLREDAKTGATGGTDQPCAYLYRSRWAMKKCVPWVSPSNLDKVLTQEQTAGAVTTDYVAQWLGTTQQIFSTFMVDVAQSLYVVGPCIFIATIFAINALVMLRYCVEYLAKSLVFIMLGLVILISWMTWRQYEYYKHLVNEVPQVSTHEQDTQSMYVYLVLFIMSCVVGVCHLFFSIYMWPTIGAAVSVVQVAIQAFEDAPQLYLYPVVHMLSFLALIVFWLMGAIMLYCSGEIDTASNGVAFMEHTPHLRSCIFSYTFGLFWFSGFMNAMGYMIVAGTIYLTTFAQPKNLMYPEPVQGVAYSGQKHVPHSVMSASVMIMVRYHMGTAALGSFILSVVWPFRTVASVLSWVARRCESDVTKYLSCCCQCSLWCFDGCLKYMNKMAYLQTVLHGYSFCGAAFEGLECVMQGIHQVSDTTLISSFVLVIIKCSITFTVTFLAMAFVKTGLFGVTPEDLTYSWVPFLLTACCSYVICTAFMLIVEVAIDAVMVAFCEAKFVPKGAIKAIKDHQLSSKLRSHMVDWGNCDDDNGELEPLNTK